MCQMCHNLPLIFNFLVSLRVFPFKIFNFLIFKFFPMTRRALASMYFSDKSPIEAVRSLRRWIVNCPDRVSALEEIDQPYKKTKILTARQGRLIMQYLGDP